MIFFRKHMCTLLGNKLVLGDDTSLFIHVSDFPLEGLPVSLLLLKKQNAAIWSFKADDPNIK